MEEEKVAEDFAFPPVWLIINKCLKVEEDIVELENLMRANFLVVADEVDQDSEEGENDLWWNRSWSEEAFHWIGNPFL